MDTKDHIPKETHDWTCVIEVIGMDKDLKFLERFQALEARVQKLEALISSASSAHEIGTFKKLSAREFLLTKRVKSGPEMTLALGYFLEHMKGMASFNVSDLEGAFHEVKEAPPKNINDTAYQCIKRGFMMEAMEKKDSRKAWCLTATGEKQVETELNKQGE